MEWTPPLLNRHLSARSLCGACCARDPDGQFARPLPIAVFPCQASQYLTAGHVRVRERIALSSPHRTAVGIACGVGKLQVGTGNEDFGLSSSAYANSAVKAILISVVSETRVTVTIVFSEVSRGGFLGWFGWVEIPDGATLTQVGICSERQLQWQGSSSSTVAERFRPLIYR